MPDRHLSGLGGATKQVALPWTQLTLWISMGLLVSSLDELQFRFEKFVNLGRELLVKLSIHVLAIFFT
jgi:hypothetical protein